jgi:hypothetical protein
MIIFPISLPISACIILLFVRSIESQHLANCGSLITYRQLSALLETAPRCFRTGCSSDTTPSWQASFCDDDVSCCSNNVSIRSISSACWPQSPCSTLWSIIDNETQLDRCNLCTDDIACRIAGWPVLNASSICEFQPQDWLFYTNGKCSTSGSEPFRLAEWIGSLCDRDWRRPFEFYGGMAREDWEEWIQPWNWTVRAENTSTQCISLPDCPSASHGLWVFFAQNLVMAVLLPVTWKLVKRYREAKKSRRRNAANTPVEEFEANLPWYNPRTVKKFIQSTMESISQSGKRIKDGSFGWVFHYSWIAGGIGAAGSEILFSFVGAYLVKNIPGYRHVPIPRLAL